MTEDYIEQSTLETLRQIGWQILHGPDIGPDGSGERDYRDTVLNNKLAGALIRLNQHIPQTALDEAFKKIVRVDKPTLLFELISISR